MDEHGRFTIPVDPVFSHKVYDSSKSDLDKKPRNGFGCTVNKDTCMKSNDENSGRIASTNDGEMAAGYIHVHLL